MFSWLMTSCKKYWYVNGRVVARHQQYGGRYCGGFSSRRSSFTCQAVTMLMGVLGQRPPSGCCFQSDKVEKKWSFRRGGGYVKNVLLTSAGVNNAEDKLNTH